MFDVGPILNQRQHFGTGRHAPRVRSERYLPFERFCGKSKRTA
jgi:hypothetical protein